MLQKVIIVALLLVLFPVLLKIGFYVFLFFLGLSLVATVAFYLARQKMLKNLQTHLGRKVTTSRPDDTENIVIDVKAERRN
ncbi:MAG: hypothetical protein K6G15_07785 [Desulfovibrio sp.]|nr:hypothetical protein [Desulfovibrio sp.]